jgi:hypothetical protein
VDKPAIYWLGCGDWHPRIVRTMLIDVPWTDAPDGRPAADCRFVLNYCYRLPAHRPGFNHGSWATISDDVNSNSAIEDAEHNRELFRLVDHNPLPGDILCYPTIHLPGHPPFIGHSAMVVGLSRAARFDLQEPSWSLLDIVHCHGPQGRSPAVTRGDGAAFDLHDSKWHKPEHRTKLLRLVP